MARHRRVKDIPKPPTSLPAHKILTKDVKQAVTEHALQLQPRSNFFKANVTPLSDSGLQLPGGKTEPFYYCLGVDSTIPFVSLQGGGVSQKIFSWGEMIEVPPGQTVTVKNESFMRGDIAINSGHDFSAKPERISVPWKWTSRTIPEFPGFILYEAPFPADTRRCRRAMLSLNLTTFFASILVSFSGRAIKHSFPSPSNIGGPTGYDISVNIPPMTFVDLIPMSYGSDSTPDINPAGLTDQVSPLIVVDQSDTVPIVPNDLAFYVLEY